MKMIFNSHIHVFTFLINIVWISYGDILETGLKSDQGILCNDETRMSLSKMIIPALEGKRKGEAGKIGVIGGSYEYTGAPYFAAITSLKIGADLVYVITTESASPVIKSYSPDLIVYPLLNTKSLPKVITLLSKMDVIIIGPGLGREDEIMSIVYSIIDTCRELNKPLVIDADGLYAISKNLASLSSYPSPGVILTPNQREAELLKQATNNNDFWYNHWGDYVSVLIKGEEDHYYSKASSWTLKEGGSGRRAGGQGDILAGTLGTFYNWALKANISQQEDKVEVAKGVATYAAAKFTRTCNLRAFVKYGRSMTASDMLEEIHYAFVELFGK